MISIHDTNRFHCLGKILECFDGGIGASLKSRQPDLYETLLKDSSSTTANKRSTALDEYGTLLSDGDTRLKKKMCHQNPLADARAL